MNERIVQVRKQAGLTQEQFAGRIGLSRNFIWMIEKGERIPSDRTITDICREFHVSEIWLRTGEGKMLLDLGEKPELTRVLADIQLSSDTWIQNFLLAYGQLDREEKAALKKFFALFSACQKEKTGL